MLIKYDGAGADGQVEAELSPHGEGGGHQEHEPEHPRGGNVQRQPAGGVDSDHKDGQRYYQGGRQKYYIQCEIERMEFPHTKKSKR